MKILMVSAEVLPFAKTGGLADAVTALSRTLALKGNDVKVVLPRYYSISRDMLSLVKKSLLVSTGWSDILADLYSCQDSFLGVNNECHGNLEYYFIDQERLFGRDGIYGNNYEKDFHDNPLRFSVLCRAVFAMCRAIGWIPDIIHSHDWSAAMTPVILNFIERNNFPNTKTVFTIHNLGYQGAYPDCAYRLLGLSDSYKFDAHISRFGGLNFLQAGIYNSDFVTTVSKTYAKEIKTPKGGCGLDALLRSLDDVFLGIINGADTAEWNPVSDKYLIKNYSKDDLSGKSVCKSYLQKKFGLRQDSEIPVIGIISRMVEQKGIKELFAPYYGCMYRMCRDFNAQFIVVGQGEQWCENEVRYLSGEFENFASYIGYSEEISHIVEAGSDYFLMPSKYEPCGLNQIYSMLYGTLPIVHATGGLEDTVINFSQDSDNSNGFKFYDLTPDAVYNTVKWALGIFHDKSAVRKMQYNGMASDFSWSRSADEYISVYQKLLLE
ncbi:MAG: glycogen synthase [Treponema sp.]|nr:glycogen synthase [Treponema sp.]